MGELAGQLGVSCGQLLLVCCTESPRMAATRAPMEFISVGKENIQLIVFRLKAIFNVKCECWALKDMYNAVRNDLAS